MTAKEERKHLKDYLSNFDSAYLSNWKERNQNENFELERVIWRNQCEIEIINEISKDRGETEY